MTQLVTGYQDLTDALRLGKDYLPTETVERAEEVAHRVQARTKAAAEYTIVALAGGTGAGKSSLVNALVGEQVARVAATRPTTSEAQAISNVPATDALDMLEITKRHVMPDLLHRFGSRKDAGELILVDLPDIDSTEYRNREIARRLTREVDVAVYVLDPQKYADAIVHEDYLSQLGEHAEITLVVLNQADRVSETELAGILADIDRILEADGLDAKVIATSALTGKGVPDLRRAILDLVASRAAAKEKLAADLRTVGRDMAGDVQIAGGRLETPEGGDFDPVSHVLAEASGAGTVARAAADSYRLKAKKATGWPLVRWVNRAKIDPLRRLRLDRPVEPKQIAPATGLSISPAKKAQAKSELSRFTTAETDHLPRKWAIDAREDADQAGEKLFAQVDQVLAEVDLGQKRRPFWWGMFNFLQWLLLFAAVAGGVWLLLLYFADFLKLQLPDPPAFGIFPAPTIMLVLGLLLGWMLAGLGRVFAVHGAERLRRRVEDDIAEQIEARAHDVVLAPISTHRDNYAQFIAALSRLVKTHV